MKNFIKKITVSLFALTFLFIGQSVFASNIWNNGSQGPECSDINIASGNNGWGSPCWNGTNITVQPGSTVSVKIYYHNASTPAITATNTRIKLIPSNGSSTNHSFSGQILSPQGNLYTDSVTANVYPAQTLTYSSTTWYVQNSNGTLVQTPLLNGRNGSEVIGSNGLYIGNVVSGWANGQGAVVVNFTVSNSAPQSNCSISSFTANPNSVVSGGITVLSWNTDNCTSGYINQGVGSVNSFPGGNKTVYNLNNTTTYTLTAYGSNGYSDTESVTVNVENLPTTGNLTASYSSCVISSGQSTCNIPFSWNTINPIQGAVSSITHNWSTVASGNSGNQSFSISNGSQTYYLYHNSQLLDQETVNANCASGSSWNGYSCSVQTINDCSISDFNASPDSIDEGDSSNLSWDISGNCTSASINNGVGSVNIGSGSRNVYPDYTTTYTLTVYNNSGYSTSRSVTVYVDENQNSDECRISYFRASPDSIDEGDSSKLTWDTNGDCDSASINKGVGSVDENGGTEYVYPDSTTTYKLTVYGEDGDSDSETVTVDVDDEEDDDCRISYFTANPSTINYGDLSNLSWNTDECNSVSISSIGSVNESGNQVIYPKSTTTYTIYAYGESGSPVSKTVRVNVNNYNYTPTPIYNTCAVTTVATNITSNSATLNGLITNPNGSANTYFEYGKTVDLGMQTNTRSINGNTSFADIVTGLSPNTIYFYRIVSNCNNGISKGSIEILKTAGNNVSMENTRTIIRQGTTVIGAESPIMLKIENRYESIRENDIIDYIITYKNIGSKTLTNPVLQVVLPKGINYLKSSRGTYSEDSQTLTVSLKDLLAGDEGVVYLQGKVDFIARDNAQIVTTAILVYTSTKGAQENAIAYVLNNPIIESSLFGLGALALFGNIFGMGILGWLILLILILLAILLFRKVYHRN